MAEDLTNGATAPQPRDAHENAPDPQAHTPASAVPADNLFEHFFQLDGSDDAGAVGRIEEVAASEAQIKLVHGLVFDLDVKYLKPDFRRRHLAYLKHVLPELELRQTSPDGNLHGILHLDGGIRPSDAKALSKPLQRLLLADPSQSWSAKARAAGSTKTKPGQPPFVVKRVQVGRRVKHKDLVARVQGADDGASVTRLEERMFGALARVLTTKDGEPLLSGGDQGVCPIHGSGKNRKQCKFHFDQAICVCYGDCGRGDGGHRIDLAAIVKARVLNDPGVVERVLGSSGRPRVLVTPGMNFKTQLETLGQALAQTRHVFNRDGVIATDEGGSLRPVTSADDLAGVIGTLTDCRIAKAGSIEAGLPPKSVVSSLMPQTSFKNFFPRIGVLSRAPLLGADGSWSQPGYNDDGTYYEGAVIAPATGTRHLDELLGMFCFARPTDKASALALMVDRLLSHSFRGDRPIGVIKGNQPGIGKSTLARCVAIIAGEEFTTMSYGTNDEEFEKQLATHVQRSAVVTIDNVRLNAAIASPVLERTLTAPTYTFRRLGTNTAISGANNLLFLITLNGGELSPDLIDRSLFVCLEYTGDPRRRTTGISPIEYCGRHRHDIVAELMGMVTRWHEAGRPVAPSTFRFRPWAADVGGVLAFNNVPQFLTSLVQDHAEYVQQDPMLVALAESAPGKRLTAAEWVEQAGRNQCLPNEWKNDSPRGQATKMGRRLTDVAGRVIQIRSESGSNGLIVRASKDGKNSYYSFEPEQQDSADTAVQPGPAQQAIHPAIPNLAPAVSDQQTDLDPSDQRMVPDSRHARGALEPSAGADRTQAPRRRPLAAAMAMAHRGPAERENNS